MSRRDRHSKDGSTVKPPIRLGIAGLGTVGVGVVELAAAQRRSARRCAAAGASWSSAVSARDRRRDRGLDLSAMRWFDDAVAMAGDPDIDVVVELIGGADGVARAVVETALDHGKPVVTANKALMARHGTTLAQRAEAKGVALAFEAAVAGGIPIIKALREGLAANRFTRIYGILNGTCNYILTTMRESGREFGDVLAEAQKLGYAEADPSFDIDGIDAAHKLAILSSVAFGSEVDFAGIHVEGIRHISRARHRISPTSSATASSCSASRASPSAASSSASMPAWCRWQTPIAHVEGVFNAVVAEGDFVGTRRAAGPRRRRRADRLGRRRRPHRHRRRPSHPDLRRARRGAAEASGLADAAPPGRLLRPPHGGRPAGRHRRHRRRACATSRCRSRR